MSAAGVTLVVGGGGLVGSNVLRALAKRRRVVVRAQVPWSEPGAARVALRAGIVEALAAAGGGPLDIAWCAGAGTVATTQDDLDREVAQFAAFLADLQAEVPAGADLAFFLASSAGGLYAGSSAPPFDEHTEPRPLAPYGWAKIRMEEELLAAVERLDAPALLGRLANVYGPGQNLAKAQGVVSRLCVAHLARSPLPVTVSLDTIRDYLFVTDAAEMIVTGLEGLRDRRAATGERVVVKVMASGRSTTLSTMIAESNRVFHRRAPVSIVSSGSPGQVRDLRLRSVVWTELQSCARTTLAAGFERTAEAVAEDVVRRGPLVATTAGAR